MISRRDWQLQQLGIIQWTLKNPLALKGEISISIPDHIRLLIITAKRKSIFYHPVVNDVLRALCLNWNQILQLTSDQLIMLQKNYCCNSWQIGTKKKFY